MGTLMVGLRRDPGNWGFTEKLYVINVHGVCVGCFYTPLPEALTQIKCCTRFSQGFGLARASILPDETLVLYDQQLKENGNIRD
jgi:hypothetical protein